MIDPVLSRILRQRKVAYGISIDLVIELEKDAEASARKGSMCGFGENVIA